MADRHGRRRPVTRDVFDQNKRRLSSRHESRGQSGDGLRPDTGVWVRDTTHDIDHPIRRSTTPTRTPTFSVPEIYVREGTPDPARHTPDYAKYSSDEETYPPEHAKEKFRNDKYEPGRARESPPREVTYSSEKSKPKDAKDKEFSTEHAKHKPESKSYTAENAQHTPNDDRYKIEQAKHIPKEDIFETEHAKHKNEDKDYTTEQAKHKPEDVRFTPEQKENKELRREISENDFNSKDNSEDDNSDNKDAKSVPPSKTSKRPFTSKHRLESSTFGPYSYMKSTSHFGENGTTDSEHQSSSSPEHEDRAPPTPVNKRGTPFSRPVTSSRPPKSPVRSASPPPAAVPKETRKREMDSDTDSIVGDLPPKRPPYSRNDFRTGQKREFGVRKGSIPRSESKHENTFSRNSITSSKDPKSNAPKRVTSRVEKATNRLNRSRLSKSSTLSISYNHGDIVDDNLLISASKLDNTLLRLFSNARDPKTKKEAEDEDELIPYLNYSESDLISMEPVRWRVFPMEAAHKETLEQEMPYIEDNVQPYGVIKTLYDDDVLTHMDFTQFGRTEGQGDRAVTRLLVKTLQRRGNKAYPAFVDALRTNDYPQVSAKLEETERAIRQGMMDEDIGRSKTAGSLYSFKPTPPPPRKPTPAAYYPTPQPGSGEHCDDPLAYYRRLAELPPPPSAPPAHERPDSEMLVVDSKDLEKHLMDLSKELQEIQNDVDALRNPPKPQNPSETPHSLRSSLKSSPEANYVSDQPKVRPQKSSACTVL